MSKPKTDISEIIEGIITYAPTKSKQDAEEQIDRDKVNYLIWQIKSCRCKKKTIKRVELEREKEKKKKK